MNLDSDYLPGEDDGGYGPDLRQARILGGLSVQEQRDRESIRRQRDRERQASSGFNRHMIDLFNSSRR